MYATVSQNQPLKSFFNSEILKRHVSGRNNGPHPFKYVSRWKRISNEVYRLWKYWNRIENGAERLEHCRKPESKNLGRRPKSEDEACGKKTYCPAKHEKIQNERDEKESERKDVEVIE